LKKACEGGEEQRRARRRKTHGSDVPRRHKWDRAIAGAVIYKMFAVGGRVEEQFNSSAIKANIVRPITRGLTFPSDRFSNSFPT
jgi:hypothetical protein